MSDKIKVSDRALVQRINRVLAKKNQKLVKSRSVSEKSNFGDWYILDTNTNTVTAYRNTLDILGRELGALRPHEYLGED